MFCLAGNSGIYAKQAAVKLSPVDKNIVGLRKSLLAHSARVARRLFAKGIFGDIVTIKIKYSDFTTCTARVTLPEPVMDTDSIFAAALKLLERRYDRGRAVRLTGVSLSGLTGGPIQCSLFGDARREKREAIEALSAKVRGRFGGQSLVRATLLDED